MKSNLHDSIGAAILTEPADLVATDTKSKYVDTAGYQEIDLLVIIGALTGVDASNYLTPTLQHSDTTDDADFEAVAAADIIGAFSKVDAASEDSLIQRVGYVGSKRYVRVLLDYTGAGITAGIVGVVALAGGARSEPAADPTTGTAA